MIKGKYMFVSNTTHVYNVDVMVNELWTSLSLGKQKITCKQQIKIIWLCYGNEGYKKYSDVLTWQTFKIKVYRAKFVGKRPILLIDCVWLNLVLHTSHWWTTFNNRVCQQSSQIQTQDSLHAYRWTYRSCYIKPKLF